MQWVCGEHMRAGMPILMSHACIWLMQSVNTVQVAEVVAEEWVQSIRDSYRPSRVADGLWIIPDWCAAPSTLQPSCSSCASTYYGCTLIGHPPPQHFTVGHAPTHDVHPGR